MAAATGFAKPGTAARPSSFQGAGRSVFVRWKTKRRYPPPPRRPPAAAQPVQRVPAPAPPAAAVGARSQTLRLKLHSFADVWIGNPSAYTVGLPPGWSAEGNVEWSTGPTPYPQQKFRIRCPGGGRCSTAAAVHFMYTEAVPIPGLPQLPSSGVPAPRDFPRWYLDFVGRNQSGNIRLVEARRDEAAEAMWARMQQRQQNPGCASGLVDRDGKR
jgi:hypothetical protein